MANDLENIKDQILDELETTGSIDIGRWTTEYPSHKAEILDFSCWAELSTGEPDQDDEWEDPDQVAQRTLQSWCTILRDEQRESDKDLSGRLRIMRQMGAMPSSSGGKAFPNDKFKRAAVMAWTVHRISKDGKVSRYKTGKCLYLLERGMKLGLFTKHKKMPRGPYDSTLRYKDAEPIAQKKGWILVEEPSLQVGDSIEEADKYAPRYLRDDELATEFLLFIAEYSDQELETLTTVDAITVELLKDERSVSVEAIKQALDNSREWDHKLSMDNFTDTAISEAIDRLRILKFI